MKCSCLLLYLSVQLDAPQIVLHCIVYFSTVHTNWLTIYVSAEVMPPSVFSRLCKLLYTKLMQSRNCSITRQSSRTELHFSSGWIASPATRDCLSRHLILWRLMPLKPMLNDYFRCVVIWQQENGTELGYPSVQAGISETELLLWTRCTVNWSVTCFWYCTAEDRPTLQRLCFATLT